MKIISRRSDLRLELTLIDKSNESAIIFSSGLGRAIPILTTFSQVINEYNLLETF